MRQAVELVGIVNLVLFAAIAVVCVRQWSTERAPTALWAALAFVNLAAVIVVGQLLPDEPQQVRREGAPARGHRVPGALPVSPLSLRGRVRGHEAPARAVRRFAHHRARRRDLRPAARAGRGRSWPWWFAAYVIAFVIHWSVLLLIVAVRLWRAGRTEATVARRRMEMLAVASTAITAALVLAAAGARRRLGARARDRAPRHAQRGRVHARLRAARAASGSSGGGPSSSGCSSRSAS